MDAGWIAIALGAAALVWRVAGRQIVQQLLTAVATAKAQAADQIAVDTADESPIKVQPPTTADLKALRDRYHERRATCAAVRRERDEAKAAYQSALADHKTRILQQLEELATETVVTVDAPGEATPAEAAP